MPALCYELASIRRFRRSLGETAKLHVTFPPFARVSLIFWLFDFSCRHLDPPLKQNVVRKAIVTVSKFKTRFSIFQRELCLLVQRARCLGLSKDSLPLQSLPIEFLPIESKGSLVYPSVGYRLACRHNAPDRIPSVIQLSCRSTEWHTLDGS